MSQTEKQIRRANPIAIGLVIGLGWGLVFGFVDGLSVLLELPILLHLRVRLQALTYLMMWSGLVGAILFGVSGLVVWRLLRLFRPQTGRRELVAICSGTAVGLAALATGVYSLDIPFKQLSNPGYVAMVLVLIGLGGVLGTVAGLGVCAGAARWQGGRGFLRPMRWKLVRTGVLSVFAVGLVALFAIVIYRGYLRDLEIFRPKSSGQIATAEQPNILFITIDTLRADHLGAYGYDPEISPNIDALARRGVVFDQAIAQSSWTAPSVASFVTSLYPTELGIYFQRSIAGDLHVDEMRVTLAEVLHDAGYRTQAYTTNMHISKENGYAQGFDSFMDLRKPLSFDLDTLHGQTLVGLLCRAPTACELFDRGYKSLFDLPLLLWRKAGPLATEYGQRFVRQHKDERFFLWLYYMEPHQTYDPNEPFRPLPSEITLERERLLRSLDFLDLNGEEIIRPVDLQALLSLYDGEIVDVDALVGQVLDELEKQGLTNRTVVIVNADHGEEFNDHGDYTHGHTMYDELVRVPFIISGPVVEVPGRTVETQVRLLDLLPMLCEIAGAPIPAEAKGRSLMPLLQGEDMEELPAFSEVLHTSILQQKSVRYNGYKLIYHVEDESVELYDVQTDFREQINLTDQKSEIVEEMLAELQAWMTQSARRATELSRQSPLSGAMDDEARQRLRDAGY